MTRETVKSGNIKEMKPGVVKIDGDKNGRMRDAQRRRKGGGGVVVEYDNTVFFCCSGRPIEMGRKTWGRTIFLCINSLPLEGNNKDEIVAKMFDILHVDQCKSSFVH